MEVFQISARVGLSDVSSERTHLLEGALGLVSEVVNPVKRKRQQATKLQKSGTDLNGSLVSSGSSWNGDRSIGAPSKTEHQLTVSTPGGKSTNRSSIGP